MRPSGLPELRADTAAPRPTVQRKGVLWQPGDNTDFIGKDHLG